jgi:hypothetical protein
MYYQKSLTIKNNLVLKFFMFLDDIGIIFFCGYFSKSFVYSVVD